MTHSSRLLRTATVPDRDLTSALACVSRLMEQGKYGEAVTALAAFWKGPGHEPTRNLLDRELAQLWVKAGALIALIGSQRQRRGWQEEAKNVLTVAARKAHDSGAGDVWLECQKELANCYWWEGSFSEARALLTAAIEQAVDSTDIGLLLRINLTMVDRSEHRHKDALTSLLALAPLVEQSHSDTVRSRFHNALALSYKETGLIDEAIMEMTACCYYLQQANNDHLLIGAEINLGNLCVSNKRFDEALVCLSRAAALAAHVGDSIHLAHAKDSMALAYLGLHDYDAAEKEAREAVEIFERGDQYALLVDTLVTQARALVGLRRRTEAAGVYVRAQDIASQKVSAARAARVSVELIANVAGGLSLEAGMTYEQLVEQYKEALLKSALEVGSVTEAAFRLGMKHQHLSWLLNHTYPHLRRDPPRLKSVIRRPAASHARKK